MMEKNNSEFFHHTNKLIRENIELSQNIYERMEKGMTINEQQQQQYFPKFNSFFQDILKTNLPIVKLFGLDDKINAEDINDDDIIQFSRKNSDSSESQMDMDVSNNV